MLILKKAFARNGATTQRLKLQKAGLSDDTFIAYFRGCV